MPKRLQVILSDADYDAVARAARARSRSVAQWVREALESAHRREPGGAAGAKLDAVRASVQFDFPTGDIDRMLSDIEMGYGER